jgi:hypothetical protein
MPCNSRGCGLVGGIKGSKCIEYKGEKVKKFGVRKYEVLINDIGDRGIQLEKTDFKGLKHSSGEIASVREITEPSQDVEKALKNLWYDYQHSFLAGEEAFKSVFRQFVADNIKPEPPQINRVRTGVLDLPTGFDIRTSDATGRQVFCNTMKVDLVKFPQLEKFCKDIREEIDFSSIPVGSVVKVEYQDETYVGYFANHKDSIVEISKSKSLWSNDLLFKVEIIKSIEIIALPEEK